MAPSRRSARRPTHAHNASASNSKSSHSPQAEDRDSPDPPPPPPPPTTTTPAGKGGKGAGKPRRVKEEPNDSLNGDADPPVRTGKRGGKGKAKDKDKDKDKSPVDEPEPVPDEDDEESGVTRCPCGRIAADSEELGFMIMCEMCKVWQHGLCMGVQEDNVPENYYCEECRPDLHSDIPCLSELKRNKRTRHTSAMPPPIAAPSGTRSPRSHSPTASTKPKSPKRRNTMNSRDAAYDEDLKRLLALENPEPEIVVEEVVVGGKRKRKRSSAGGEGEPGPKRPRSASSASDLPIAAAATKEATPAPPPSANGASAKAKNVSLPKDPPPPPPPPAPARPKKRNGPKKNLEKEQSLDANGESTGPGGKKHPNQYTYRKQLEMERRRAEKGDAGYQPTAAARRKAAAGEGRSNKADKDSARSPAPQSVSWALPDYLQHLAHILPTETPQPIDVREGDGGVEQERGVKVKWPGKRMTIGDMNKRVRNIVEYVAREQAAAEQRRRRIDALVTARAANRVAGLTAASLSRVNDKDKDSRPVVLDEDAMDVQEDGQLQPPDDEAAVWDAPVGPEERSPTTERLMSDLMTDLIAFQEKFGQSNKNTTSSAGRARREAAVVAADRNGAAAAAAAAAA